MKSAVDSTIVPFALGELYGPIRCESLPRGCKTHAWCIWMTQAEYDKARDQDLPANWVFENKIGTAFCETHRPQSNNSQTNFRRT